ncbi:MAG: hotdog fold thioesterase [Sphingobacteriia bacterium]|nr:MAG: hotdog fold thioesterase [Sphingobacteriia bacterium]
MNIWFKKNISLADFEGMQRNTLDNHLGIELTEIGPDFLKARMPVDDRTKQPFGLLHGGASLVLAETLGSFGAAMVIDLNEFICVGQEINANHLRSVRSGFVTGISRPIHIGSSSQVWDIKIYDDHERIICVSRITVAVMKKKTQSHQ